MIGRFIACALVWNGRSARGRSGGYIVAVKGDTSMAMPRSAIITFCSRFENVVYRPVSVGPSWDAFPGVDRPLTLG